MATAPANSDGESKGPISEEKVAVIDSDAEEMVRWLLKRANLSPLLRGNIPAFEDLTDAQKETFIDFLKTPESRRILRKLTHAQAAQSPFSFGYVLACIQTI